MSELDESVRKRSVAVGLRQQQTQLVLDDMSDELKQRFVDSESIAEVKNVLCEFSAEQKENGKRGLHP